jgi:hypothetical protein
MRWYAVLLVMAVAAACADAGRPDTQPASTANPSIASVASGEPTLPSTVTTEPIPVGSTVQRTDPSPVEPSVPLADGPVTLGAPHWALLPASPPDQIDWEIVGPGWLIVDHPFGYGGPFIDPTTLDRRGLYLVSPDNDVFAASALLSDGSWIADVSNDGRQVLFRLFDPVCADGCSSDMPVTAEEFGYAILDLPTTTLRLVIDPVTQWHFEPDFSRRATFTDDGQGLWVSETSLAEHGWKVTRVRLSRLDLASETWITILDETTDLDLLATFGDRTDHGHASVVELPDGRLVTESPTGVWLRDPDGVGLARLNAPETSCVLTRLWDSDHVVVRCQVPDFALAGCWTTGLWLVALDGSPYTPLAVPVDHDGTLACYYNYFDATQLGDTVAVQAGEGEGSCGHDVVFLTDDSIHPWEPDVTSPEGCIDEWLLGVRNGAFLITTGVGATFEVGLHGDTPIPLPNGEVVLI